MEQCGVFGYDRGMSENSIGLVVGGVLPAILLGLFAVMQRVSVNEGARPASLLLFAAVGILLVAGVLYATGTEAPINPRLSVAAVATGIVWAVATACIAIAQARFRTPLVQLVPLFNMNTLVAVVLGLIIFAEWNAVRLPRLLIGSVLIVAGGTLVASA